MGTMNRPPRLLATSALLGLLVCGCGGAAEEGGLVDVTADLGLPATTGAWPDGACFMPEIMPGGVALFDAEGDGDLDLLHVRVPPPGGPKAIANRLYRKGAEGKFTDVTGASGLVEEGFGQGAAVGDADNDGDLDVYVT